MKKLKEVFG